MAGACSKATMPMWSESVDVDLDRVYGMRNTKAESAPTNPGNYPEPTVIELDMCGSVLTQAVVDVVTARAHTARLAGAGLVDIVIKQVATHSVPRLITDFGDVVHLLVRELRQKDFELEEVKRKLNGGIPVEKGGG